MDPIRLVARANRPTVRLESRKRTACCTVERYAKRWIQRTAVYLAPETLRGYRHCLRIYIIPELGNIRFTRLTRDKVAQFINDLSDRGLMRGTVSNIIVVLRRMYYDAMEHGEVLYNPASGALRGIENRRARPPYEPFSLEEARRFLVAAKKYEPHWYPILLCALTTGMRQGELLALRPSDIDFVSGFITVRSSFHRGVYNPPKNHKIRRIDMNERLAEVLSRYLNWKIALALELKHETPRNERRSKEKVLADVMEKSLFTTLYDCTLYDHTVYKAFRRTLKKAGLRHIRFHDLRHTFASLLLQQGESLAYVRDQLGHYSIQMTADYYGHLVARSNKAAVNDLVSSVDYASFRPAERVDRRTNATIVTRKSDYLRRSWI